MLLHVHTALVPLVFVFGLARRQTVSHDALHLGIVTCTVQARTGCTQKEKRLKDKGRKEVG
jgi:hypothetical protein